MSSFGGKRLFRKGVLDKNSQQKVFGYDYSSMNLLKIFPVRKVDFKSLNPLVESKNNGLVYEEALNRISNAFNVASEDIGFGNQPQRYLESAREISVNLPASQKIYVLCQIALNEADVFSEERAVQTLIDAKSLLYSTNLEDSHELASIIENTFSLVSSDHEHPAWYKFEEQQFIDSIPDIVKYAVKKYKEKEDDIRKN
jgi:hypothetical protein